MKTFSNTLPFQTVTRWHNRESCHVKAWLNTGRRKWARLTCYSGINSPKHRTTIRSATWWCRRRPRNSHPDPPQWVLLLPKKSTAATQLSSTKRACRRTKAISKVLSTISATRIRSGTNKFTWDSPKLQLTHLSRIWHREVARWSYLTRARLQTSLQATPRHIHHHVTTQETIEMIGNEWM